MEMTAEFPQVLEIPEGRMLDLDWKKINKYIDVQQLFHAQKQQKV